MKASDYIAAFLHKQRVTHVFELTGGMIAHILDSIHLQGNIQLVSVHHEQAASFAADAYGRLTGIPGVAMSTGGPGTTNLMTGIGSCYFDSVPAVFFSGAVNRHEQRGDRPIRQLGFQEMEVVEMVKPITKGAWQIQQPEDIPEILVKAFEVALAGRPGPTVIDVPLDIQYAQIEASVEDIPVVTGKRESTVSIASKSIDFEFMFSELDKAERPLILVGGGIQASGSIEEFRVFARNMGVPVINSLMAVDVMPYDEPLRVGFIGAYGNRWANLAISQSDFVLVLGSRLDIRQTGAKTEAFKGDRVFFHVDVEEGEMNNRITGVHAIHADIRDFLEQGIHATASHAFKDYAMWKNELQALREEWPDTKELEEIPGINPNAFLHDLSSAGKVAAAYAIDVGQHQMWSAQSIEVYADQRFITSGGMGSMGYALPAAMGAAFVAAPRPIVVVSGDGGFQCNIQEFQTIVHHKLPIKMVVLNNNAHGMLRQFQSSYFESRFQSSVWGYSTPDFTKVAEAYGIPARSITDETEVTDAIKWLWSDPTSPVLLNVKIDLYANAYPKIAFGRPISDMEPFFQPVPFGEGT